jgi:hypothetical protein
VVPDGFGALIIDTYDSDDESRAYEMLLKFAQTRPLILLATDSPLFHRISNAIKDFPKAEIIERELEPPGEWLESNEPTTSYRESSGRKAWKAIRQKLESHKVTIESPTPINMNLTIKTGQTELSIDPGTIPIDEVPVLIGTTYHPNWVREDKGPIYAATPFFMLTFVRQQTRLTFARRPSDWVSLIISASALLVLGSCMIWSYRQKLLSRWRDRNLPKLDAKTKR